jgi:hypothetical protein
MSTLLRNAHARGKASYHRALQAGANEDDKTEVALEVRWLVVGGLILSPGPLYFGRTFRIQVWRILGRGAHLL